MKKVSLLFMSLLLCAIGYTQCDEGQLEVIIEIVPDGWPGETSWELLDSNSMLLASGGAEGDTLCVGAEECMQFIIYDTYGDGIYSPGGYWIYFDGMEVATGNDFGFGEFVAFNCGVGFSCNDSELITEGTYSIDDNNYWYAFTPEANGMYEFTTCDSDCNTVIWIYDYCNMNNFDDTNEGSLYYDDNQGGCDPQATITALLEGGVTYYVRIGSLVDECENGIDWELTFVGPPTGCTDPEACNYNPLAEIDSGDCIYFGDPDCNGPDLLVLQDVLANSIYTEMLEVDESDCYIDEGCINGYGSREIIRFTTHIKNIGDIDYYIGPAGDENPGQFEYDNCHNHWHYEGYAEYVLFDDEGILIPIGFKNGFCVLDLECSDGGTAQYGCGNMGISAHCGDIYGSGLNCQWIDVTDVEDGLYTLVVRTNWDQSPDALGRIEMSYENNWAQVCLDIDRSGGSLEVEVIEDCPNYVDCMGEEFGNAQPDCTGECNGSAVMGDLDVNGEQELADANQYVMDILGDDISATSCNDLNQDGDVTVTDAALMGLCNFYNISHEHPDSSGVHNKCNFPADDITNPYDSVTFALGNVEWDENYFDVMIKNPNNRVVGYQFTVSGVEIENVVSLYDPIEYPITPAFALGGDQIIGLSYEDSTIHKNTDFVPLLRIYWSENDGDICLSEIIDVVNHTYHNTLTFIENPCAVVGVEEFVNDYNVEVYPNPFTEQTTFSFENYEREPLTIEIIDLRGRVIYTKTGINSSKFTLTSEGLSTGMYIYKISGERLSTGRIIVQNN